MDALTGEIIEAGKELKISDLLVHFPVALLIGMPHSQG
jgi:hypothetical protein